MLTKLRLLTALLTIFIFAGTPLFAQSWIIEETYGGVGDDRAFNLVSQANGNVTHIGYTTSFGTPFTMPNVHIVQSDPLGAPLWENVYNVMVATSFNSGAVETEMSIFECANGDFVWTSGIVPGPGMPTDIIVQRISPVGVPIWTSFLGGGNGGNDYSTSIIESPGTLDLLITGYTDAPPTAGGVDMIAARFTGAGALLWSGKFGGTGGEIARCIREMANGNFVIAGETNGFSASNDGIQFAITGAGAVVWATRHGSSVTGEGFSTVVENTNGDIYTCGIATDAFGNGNTYIVRSNAATGAQIAGATYDGFTGGQEGAWFINTSVTPGNLVLAGEYPGIIGGPRDGFFLEVGPAFGAAVNFRAIGTVGDERLKTIAYSPGAAAPFTLDGYWIVGSTDQPGAGMYDHYLIRTNLVGKTGCDMITTATVATLTTSANITLTLNMYSPAFFGGTPYMPVASGLPLCPGQYVLPYAPKSSREPLFNEAKLVHALQVYPQPVRAGQQAMLSLQLDRDADLEITLNDMQGREVLSMLHPGVKGDNAITLEPGSISSGSYILHVKGQGQAFSTKVMLLD